MSHVRRFFLLAIAGTLALGCADGGTGADAGDVASGTDATDTAVANDANDAINANDANGSDSGTPGDAAAGPVIHGCSAANFVDRSAPSTNRMLHVAGTAFDPPCMTIAAGQEVTFMWDFAMHPLAPGLAPSRASDPAGTEPNPIQMRATGSIYPVTFATPGDYPFYCTLHEAGGMVGVVRVR